MISDCFHKQKKTGRWFELFVHVHGSKPTITKTITTNTVTVKENQLLSSDIDNFLVWIKGVTINNGVKAFVFEWEFSFNNNINALASNGDKYIHNKDKQFQKNINNHA